MPLLALLLKGIHLVWVGLLSNVLYYIFTVQWAKRIFIVALGAAFFVAVATCVSSIIGSVSTAGLPARFVQGLGMFIPSNAAAVLACIGSVWLACLVYRLKLEAVRW